MNGNFKDFEEKVKACQECELATTRLNVVPGEGDHTTDILFIGEAPGATEDEEGRPFCGRAGNILDDLLEIANLKRENVYIANILKCRPPKNRNPKPEEINACRHHLDTQIELIKPKIICCLGNFSTAYIMEKFDLKNKIQGISKIHGQVFFAKAPYGQVKIIPLYHPAASTYNIKTLPVLEEDFAMLKSIPR